MTTNWIPSTFHDLEVLARTIFGEAGGEPEEGKRAVGHVVLNRFRSEKWFSAGTIAGVCQKKAQFSCWTPADPVYHKMLNAGLPALGPAFDAAYSVLHGSSTDPTDGSTHYYAVSIQEPVWARGHTPVIQIGHHKFYKGID